MTRAAAEAIRAGEARARLGRGRGAVPPLPAPAAHRPGAEDLETDGLAREVARLTGESLTGAVRRALAERLERERLRRGQPGAWPR
jgi:Rv0623-like transcription factor